METQNPYDQVGPYELLCKLGQGPFTTLWLAAPHGQGHGGSAPDVVLKVFTAARANDQRAAEAFTQRAERARTLVHPNILELREVGRTAADLRYVAMDYVDGIDLADFGARYQERHRQPLPTELLAHIIGAVLGALDDMHRAQPPIVHGNLSPRSVLLSRTGAVVVTISCWVPDVRHATTEDLRYKAPEQVGGEPTVAADLFAVGAILHELMSGAVFRGEAQAQQLLAWVEAGEIPRIGDRPNLPPGLDRLRMGLLERDPNDRPASAAEAYHALPPVPDVQLQLRGYVNELASPKPIPPARPGVVAKQPPTGTKAKIPWVKIAVVVAVLAAVVLAYVLGSREDHPIDENGTSGSKQDATKEAQIPEGARRAYLASLEAYNRRDAEAYYDAFATPMECFFDAHDADVRKFRRSLSQRLDPDESKLRLQSMERSDRVFFCDYSFEIPKLIVMETRGGEWKVVIETNESQSKCFAGRCAK